MITSGPALQYRQAFTGDEAGWSLDKLTTAPLGRTVKVTIEGHTDRRPVTFDIVIDGHGRLATTFTLGAPAGDDPCADWGEFFCPSELGVRFALPSTTARLSWLRDTPYSVYPSTDM